VVTKKVEEKLPPQPTIEEAKEKIEQQVQEQGVVSVVEAAVPGQGCREEHYAWMISFRIA